VAEASLEIKADPANAARYTARGNLVAVVSNGSAVLGLGNIGALASKPVMEGKAVLFKKFANIDCFDLEVDEPDPEKLAEIVCALEPSFGAINLEDIKAPDCFIVERICRERMNIPVFHDDQHGTAIVVGAAATNALRIAGKRFEDIKVVSTGGGAAGIACLNMLLKLGVRRENVWLCDLAGLVYEGREDADDAAEGGICARAPRPRRWAT
jgi:malate dehydrogenase (oxaloacetate-decarboxylating)(NADP+)